MADPIDWAGLERYFITQTPASMRYRQFADEVTPTLAETNYTHIEYNRVKDYAKAHHWLAQRDKYLIEQSPGLFTDAEVLYELVRDKLVEGRDTLTPTEFAQLSRTMLDLMRVLRDKELITESREDDDDGRVTRDELLMEIEDLVKVDPKAIMKLAQGSMEPKEEPEKAKKGPREKQEKEKKGLGKGA
jgi:hypothetical protein